MSRNLTLSTKYRPKTFNEVSEQTSIKIILENQIKNNTIKHAYLFCGGAGTGKTTTARIIANMMNDNIGNPIEMDCASHNGVDDMRNIQEQCRTKPLQGKYKIFILDECHMITTAGWNSMLKILEEPPSYVIFLFCTTDPQKIPGTILSRVQRYNFSRISTQGIIKRLKYILEQENLNDYEDAAIEYIARLAKGGMRDAITTLEKCLDYSNKLTLDVVQKVTSGGVTEQVQLNFLTLLLNNNTKDALLAFDDIYMSGIDTVLFLKLFIEFLENCVKYLITRNADIVPLSQITIDWLESHSEFLIQIKDLLMSAIRLRNDFPSEDLKILLESWIVQECN